MLDKTPNHAAFEARIYEGWEREGAFAARPDSAAPPFTIMIPPPNVTGSLHMGHALTMTVQDVLVRWRRMQGRDALWQPGTDHAGIATQMVVERLLAEQGIDRRAMGRDAFLERVWQWKAESGGTITRQLRRLGASLDWPRERFTMDDGLSAAVRKVFVDLHRDGLIYRDRRLVNWDPKLLTAISDLEVEPREVKGHLWHLRYPIEGSPGQFIVVATTRPETMLGDTAVAVNPEDPRFTALIGRFVTLPLVGRRIPIVADAYSDPEKGSGAVKITPAHDFNDFEVGRRHDLPMPSVLDAEARVMLDEIADVLNGDEAGFVRELAGVDRFAARKRIIERLEALELVEKIEPHTHQVPHGDRGGVPIEPRLTWQWYCDAATLAKPAIAAVESGATEFVPKQWENTFFAWMRDIQPWCISRQLWWGHRIPAWHAADGRIFVALSEAEAQAQAGDGVALTQDPDVLDTWFSSALWPFSTLGWPDETPEVARYYPGDVLVTGFDIIFFWVARMMMMGLHFRDAVPFRQVYIHGLVRDERGQKMSKSKGNVLDPLALIDEFGADALRFTVCALTGPGRDVKLGRQRIEEYRSFVTKLWNAARFCEANGITEPRAFDPEAADSPLALWIVDAADKAVAEATAALEAYRFDEYAQAVYRFTWGSFCDWFIELAKPVFFGDDGPEKEELRGAARHVLGVVLKLLHPAMPFVTEELWARFGYGAECSLIRAAWPTNNVEREQAAAAAVGGIYLHGMRSLEINILIAVIGKLRSVRSELQIAPGQLLELVIAVDGSDRLVRDGLERAISQLRTLGRLSGVRIVDAAETPADIGPSAQFSVPDFRIVAMLPLAGIVDLAAEAARLAKARAAALGDFERARAKLANPAFIARADEVVVEENRQRLAEAETEIARLDAALARISG